MEKKRITSIKTKIAPIINGNFVKAEGFTPSYILTQSGQRLSRVRVLATVVGKFVSESGRFASLTLDDGTATIRLKAFGGIKFDGIDIGHIVDVVARAKEYEGEAYLIPEVVYRIDNMNFELLRDLEIHQKEMEIEKRKKIVLEHSKQVADVTELTRMMKERFQIPEEEVEAFLSSEETEEKQDTRSEVLDLIEKLDSGSGCEYTELIEASGLSEESVDVAINELLADGTCFEPRPGRIKKL